MFPLGRVQPKEAPAGCECRIHRDLGIERPFCLLSTRSHIYTPRERRMGSLASIYFLWSSPCLLHLWMFLLPSFPLAFIASHLDSLPKSMAPCSAQMDKDAEQTHSVQVFRFLRGSWGQLQFLLSTRVGYKREAHTCKPTGTLISPLREPKWQEKWERARLVFKNQVPHGRS